jgi:ABC-2 type transport system permease protein
MSKAVMCAVGEDVVLRTEGLRKSFGRTTALDGLDLTVRAGEVHAFLGPNGAGKTTTLRILLGLLKADAGQATLLGGDPWRDAVELHRRLAYVPGDVTLWPGLSGGEIIDLLGRLRGGIDPKRRQALTERFDLDPTKKARAYSKGNRQKVALIAALASDAELLLLDEPTAGLAIFIVVRHTRADEEAGRLELAGSAVVGRQAPLTAALLAAVTANVVIVLLAGLWLPALGLPWAGSAALALSIGACGLAFAGLAAVTAQLAGTARGARGLAIAVLGAAFVLRAVGDTSPGGLSWLSWVSPLGWAEFTRAFGSGGERWWALTLLLAAAAVLVAAAFGLAARRDHSAGLLPDRPGRPAASGFLRGPFSLAWRLQAGVLLAWGAAYVFIFAAFGAAAKGISSFLGTSAVLRQYFLQIGYQHTIIDAYLSAVMLLAGLGAAAYATSAVLRLRTDETGNLAEPVLATATGRIRWALSHICVAVGGSGLLLAAAGLSAGLGYGILTGSVSTQLPQLLGAALARWPAAAVLAAVAVLVFGLLPWECTAVAWSAVAVVAAIALLGPSLQAPAVIMDLSPFTQVPKLGAAVAAGPLAWLCGIAVALGVAGLAGLRRRDLGDLGPFHGGGHMHDWLVDYLQIGQNLGRLRLLDPDRQMGGLERGIHDVGELVADGAQVHGVLQAGRERGDDLVGVVPGPVEPPVHHALHPAAQRMEQRRDHQGRARHHDRRG